MPHPVVVVVEDDPTIQALLLDLLSEEGYRVVPCSSGNGAVECVSQQEAPIVLLDINLPGRTGMQVLRDLREDPRFRDTPVIIMSAQPTFLNRARPLAQAVLDKPLDLYQLIEALKAAGRRAA